MPTRPGGLAEAKLCRIFGLTKMAEAQPIAVYAQAYTLTFEDDDEVTSYFMIHPSWSANDQYKHVINVLWEAGILKTVKSFKKDGQRICLTKEEFTTTAMRNMFRNVLIKQTDRSPILLTRTEPHGQKRKLG